MSPMGRLHPPSTSIQGPSPARQKRNGAPRKTYQPPGPSQACPIHRLPVLGTEGRGCPWDPQPMGKHDSRTDPKSDQRTGKTTEPQPKARGNPTEAAKTGPDLTGKLGKDG